MTAMAQCLSPDQVAQDALRSLDQQQFMDYPWPRNGAASPLARPDYTCAVSGSSIALSKRCGAIAIDRLGYSGSGLR
ncbi:MAG: hypothetical protein F6K04_06890 [Leptolyngbya sp. SIO4C5]|nr:hypothetical protein [Leptolyngbya sp. SIO4C5]